MHASLVQTPIPWSQAHAELKALRHRIADVFDNFYQSLPEQDRQRLQVAIARYPYADRIVSGGYPYWPNETEVPPDFIVSSSLPFGFILENCCEVSELLFTQDSLEQFSQALLAPRETIGLFELVDSHNRGS